MAKTQLSMFDYVEDQAANVQEQVLDASATGGVTQQAEDPTQDRIQVANILSTLLNATTKMKAARKGVEGEAENIGGRVTTQIEKRLATDKDEKATQDYWAKELLSPERYESFKSRNFSATSSDEQQVLDKAAETLSSEQAMEDMLTTEKMLNMTSGDNAIVVKKNKRDKKGRVVIDDDIDFNFERIKTDDDIKKVIQATSKIYKKETQAATGGKVSREETKEEAMQLLADELGLAKKVLKKGRGLLDASESTALRMLLVKSAAKINILQKKINGTFVDENGEKVLDTSTKTLFALRRQLALHAGLQIAAKKQQTQLARGLSSYNIDVGENIVLEDKLMNDVINSAGGIEDTKKMAQGLQKAFNDGGNPGLNTFVDKANAWGNAAYEIYINGLLSGPKTFFKNALGTPLWMTYLLAEDGVAATLNSLERTSKKWRGKKLTPQDAEGVYYTDLAAQVYGYIHAFRDAWANSVETIKTESSAAAVGKVDTAKFKSMDSQALGKTGWWGNTIDYVGRITRIPGLGLQSTDDFWKGIAQRAELYRQAVNKANKSKFLGKTDEESAQDGLEVLLDPDSIAEEIDYAANYATLTNDTKLFGKISRAIQRAPFGRLVMPFATVPTNVAINATSRSILQAINPFIYRDIFFGGPAKRGKALAKVGTATGMFMYVTHLATEGRVTGALPRDKKEREMLPPGWQPHSLVFRGEGFPEDKPLFDKYGNPNGKLTYVSYAGLEPVGLLFALGANYVESARRSRDLNWLNGKADRYVFGMLDYIQEMPMIHTFGTISKAFQEGDVSIIYNSPMSNFIGPIPKPYSSLIRNISRLEDTERTKVNENFELWTLDDVLKDAKENNRYGIDGEPYYENIGLKKSMVERILALDTPALQEVYARIETAQVGNKDRKAPQYDVFGKVKTKGVKLSTNRVLALWNMITPFTISHGEPFNELQAEIVRLRVPLVTERNTIKGVPLTRMQASEWTEYAKNQQLLRIKGRRATFVEALENLFYSRSYSRMTDKQRQAAIKSTENKYYEAASEEFLFQAYPQIFEAITNRQEFIGGGQ
tara:strand:+ start:3354 stop:6515 length:3162 start_codon:yes stop_codon:yes gene_type:complete